MADDREFNTARYENPSDLVQAMQAWAQTIVPADEKQLAWLKGTVDSNVVEHDSEARNRQLKARKLAEDLAKKFAEIEALIGPTARPEDPRWGTIETLRRFLKVTSLARGSLKSAASAPHLLGGHQKWQALRAAKRVEFEGRFQTKDELTAIAVHVGLFAQSDANTVIKNSATSRNVEGATLAQAKNFIGKNLRD